jgi:hypothetical protein
MNISDLAKAIEVACAKSLADKAFASVALEPKSLRDLMVPEVLVTENETTVVYINEHGVRVRPARSVRTRALRAIRMLSLIRSTWCIISTGRASRCSHASLTKRCAKVWLD